MVIASLITGVQHKTALPTKHQKDKFKNSLNDLNN